MNRLLTGAALTVLLSFQAQATEPITREHIQQVVDITDTATVNRDTAGIGAYLSESFLRIIEIDYSDKYLARVRLGKEEYLELIDEGWPALEEYGYRREDTKIHVKPDGSGGESYSTITETLSLGGTKMVSRYREHALYAMENGKPVITQISGHTLIGDTMRQPENPFQ